MEALRAPQIHRFLAKNFISFSSSTPILTPLCSVGMCGVLVDGQSDDTSKDAAPSGKRGLFGNGRALQRRQPLRFATAQ